MHKNVLTAAFVLSGIAQAAHADAPKVVTDIAPIYSIVSKVMNGVGEPTLIVEQAASPHDFALRPSHAQALEQADVVVSVSEGLAPWLVRPIETLATQAEVIYLAEIEGTKVLDTRTGHGVHEAHDDHEEHGDDHEGHDDHGDDDHAEHEEHHDDHGHSHGDEDPHSWLNPDNGALWAVAIADVLAEQDPENEGVYQENAASFVSELAEVSAGIEETLKSANGAFVVQHDSLQYFEDRFQFPSAGAIADGEAADPGPRRLKNIRALIRDNKVTCVAVEPNFDDRIIQTISPDNELAIVVADPLGGKLPLNQDLYVATLTDIAEGLAECSTR
ncbi:zinc ABC transporter substrate-binding protein [Falsihalocynthiibacter sp. SS001]|uniref:zinc ABC transporter substrate-binding protein n=1 Tax=Falsihalocynthiibacter sp. SS001 TaxID=3349698 RepID=UPI0036D42722